MPFIFNLEMRDFFDARGRTSPPASPERARWRAGAHDKAYLQYVEEVSPRRTKLIEKRPIY
jgi:hypothetical protein